MRYRFGPFELRPDQGELLRHGRPIALQPQPLRVLTILASRAGELVRRTELFEELWGNETHVDFDRGLNYCIKRIRDALGDDAAEPAFIRTVPRYGYRFIAAVEALPLGDALPAAPRRRPAIYRAAAAAATGFVLVLVSLGITWWFAPAGADPPRTPPLALQEFLRAEHLAQGGQPQDVAKRIEHLERALAIDPNFARGHLALAQAWMQLPGEREQQAARSLAAVTKALELDPKLAEAHAHLANIKRYANWDWDGAEASYRQAVAAAPRVAALRHDYASFLTMLGRHDAAIEQIERAMELDPVSTSIKADAGWYYYQARRYDEAARLCQATLEIDPDNENALWCLLQARRLAGREAAALDAAKRLARLKEPGHAATMADLNAFWRWYLDWLERNPSNGTASTVGLGHLALGQRERALELFEQAYERRSSCVLSLPADPQLDPLRGDPRFDQLLTKLGLPG